MKTNLTSPRRRHSRNGSAVIVIMALLGIMLALITANVVSVQSLNRELHLLDNKQKHRLEHGPAK